MPFLPSNICAFNAELNAQCLPLPFPQYISLTIPLKSTPDYTPAFPFPEQMFPSPSTVILQRCDSVSPFPSSISLAFSNSSAGRNNSVQLLSITSMHKLHNLATAPFHHSIPKVICSIDSPSFPSMYLRHSRLHPPNPSQPRYTIPNPGAKTRSGAARMLRRLAWQIRFG